METLTIRLKDVSFPVTYDLNPGYRKYDPDDPDSIYVHGSTAIPIEVLDYYRLWTDCENDIMEEIRKQL
jgi:hypothetical protein